MVIRFEQFSAEHRMLTSSIAQRSKPLSPSPAVSADDRKRATPPDVAPDETLTWTPEVVLAQPLATPNPELDAVVAAATEALAAGTAQSQAADSDSWDRLMHALLQSGTLQPSGTPIDHADMLTHRTATFSVNGGSQTRLLKEIELWLQGLVVSDASLFEYTEYSMESLAAQIVRESTSAVLSGGVHNMKGRHEGKVDVPIFRLPDSKSPFITIYRIRVDVWSSKQRAFVVRQNDELVLSGQYNVRYFKLRDAE